jgi:hypothetical protein
VPSRLVYCSRWTTPRRCGSTLVARAGIEPATFRFSDDDCQKLSAASIGFVSQRVRPCEPCQRFATIIGVLRALKPNKRRLGALSCLARTKGES